ncbi:MAG: hypothetical protein O2780_01370 [Proteobacteria bacterium]|jgi:hypothetical protein|nr:hypothetical protein [Pseudomonadota bacterium]
MHLPGRWAIITLLLLLAVGARYWDLASHFSHVDDYGVAQSLLAYQSHPAFERSALLQRQQDNDWSPITRARHGVTKALDGLDLLVPIIDFSNKVERLGRFSKYWTYAPAQFLLTDSLLDPTQSYREKLYWGRMPSLWFGLLALALWLRFYRLFDWKGHGALVALALLALSWENIIYAKQQSSYSVGVLAMVTMMLMVVWHAGRQALSAGAMFVTTCVLILFCYAQYQTLFLLPAFFLVLLRHYGLPPGEVRRWPGRVVGTLTAGGALLLAALVPLYHYCLRYHQASGIHWNGGPNQEFVLDFTKVESISGIIVFLTSNTYLTLQAMTAVVPETSPMYGPLGIIFAVLFLLGIIGFWRSSDTRERRLGLFMGLVALTWAGLLTARIITLSPTRHSLILLPVFGIVIGQGLTLCTGEIARVIPRQRAEVVVSYGFCLILVAAFASHLIQVLDSRADPFSEQELIAWVRNQQVNIMIGSDWTGQPGLMPGFAEHSYYYQDLYFYLPPPSDPSPSTDRTKVLSTPPQQRIAWLSHRHPIDSERFTHAARGLARYLSLRARMGHALPVTQPGRFDDYQITTRIEIPSDIEMDISNRTSNGSNGYYFYLLEQRPSGADH